MATFISTLRFTEKGLSTIQESPKRAAAFKATAKKLGCKVLDEYWTLGPFDGVIIFDAPDDQSATALMLHLSSQGNVHTSTVRAFATSEMDKVGALLAKRERRIAAIRFGAMRLNLDAMRTSRWQA